jgi:hypothetical protein
VGASERMEGETSTQSRNDSTGVRASSCIFPFNDAASSDVVVRLMTGAGDGKDEDSKSLDLHLHRSILIESSSFFSAQLSDRWEDACTRDANGRPLLVIKECKNPEDVAIALQQLSERAPGNSEKCPVHNFSSFEDAIQCLEPADQLGLSSVLSSAVDYLESIPWTDMQAEEIRATLSQPQFLAADFAQKLLDRMQGPSCIEDGPGLLDELIQTAFTSDDAAVTHGARSSIQEMMKTSDLSGLLTAGLRRSFWQIKEALQDRAKFWTNLNYNYSRRRDEFELDPELSKLVSNLAWIFEVPEVSDLRKHVIHLFILLQTKFEPGHYEENIFHRYIAEDLYLPVIRAVAEGKLVIDTELRTKLLRIWVPENYAHSTTMGMTYLHSEAMQSAFNAVLSTLNYKAQKQVLQEWPPDLIAAQPWEPWFKEWMTRNAIEEQKVRSLSGVRYLIVIRCSG